MINEKYADYAWEQTAALLAIDSPSGFTRRAAEWVKDAFEALGFPAVRVRTSQSPRRSACTGSW